MRPLRLLASAAAGLALGLAVAGALTLPSTDAPSTTVDFIELRTNPDIRVVYVVDDGTDITLTDSKGSACAPAIVRIVQADGDRVYQDGDVLSAVVRYETGSDCQNLGATFIGEHVPGSPDYERYCSDENPPDRGAQQLACIHGYETEIPGATFQLESAAGTLAFLALPGVSSRADLPPSPELEGFRLCSVRLTFLDQEQRELSGDFAVGCLEEYERDSSTPRP